MALYGLKNKTQGCNPLAIRVPKIMIWIFTIIIILGAVVIPRYNDDVKFNFTGIL